MRSWMCWCVYAVIFNIQPVMTYWQAARVQAARTQTRVQAQAAPKQAQAARTQTRVQAQASIYPKNYMLYYYKSKNQEKK